LAAKPVLDILVGRPEDAVVSDYIEVLVLAGYTHRGQQGIPGREFFRRGDPRAYHVHLSPIASQFWLDHLTFRVCLRADDALRDAYAELKRDLAARFPRDREAYIAAKEPFVSQVLRSAASRREATRARWSTAFVNPDGEMSVVVVSKAD